MSSPQEIQQQIEQTRSNLSTDVERLNEKVSPSRVVGRRVDRIKGGATSVKERVMGAAPDAGTLRSAQDSAGSAVDSVRGGVGDAVSTVSDAPNLARQQTQGNPVAAGIIAFGAGLLVASLFPASEKEQQLSAQVEAKAKEAAEPLKDEAKQLADELREPAQHSAEQLKSTAQDAVSQTADQARDAAQGGQEPFQQ
jgi:gas vesicle protein